MCGVAAGVLAFLVQHGKRLDANVRVDVANLKASLYVKPEIFESVGHCSPKKLANKRSGRSLPPLCNVSVTLQKGIGLFWHGIEWAWTVGGDWMGGVGSWEWGRVS